MPPLHESVLLPAMPPLSSLNIALAVRLISILCCAIAYPSSAFPPHDCTSLCPRWSTLNYASAPPLFALPLLLSSLPCHSPSPLLLASPRLCGSLPIAAPHCSSFATHIQAVPYFALARQFIAFPLQVCSPHCHSLSSLHIALAMHVRSQPFNAAAGLGFAFALPVFAVPPPNFASLFLCNAYYSVQCNTTAFLRHS